MNPEKVKRKNEKWLKKHGFRVNPNLPVIEDPSALSLRSPLELSSRAWLLKYLIGIGYKQNAPDMKDAIMRKELAGYLSKAEKLFLNQSDYTERERWEAVELCHCTHGLVWILGYEDLDPLGKCPDTVAEHFFGNKYDIESFATNAKPRSFDEVYTMSDLLYRLHWSIRDEVLKGQSDKIHEWTVMNRRKAIDWALTVQNDWDDITTDT